MALHVPQRSKGEGGEINRGLSVSAARGGGEGGGFGCGGLLGLWGRGGGHRMEEEEVHSDNEAKIGGG